MSIYNFIMLARGRHWDPKFYLGLIGIEFENFWDWDSFFLNLGLGLGFFCRPLTLLAFIKAFRLVLRFAPLVRHTPGWHYHPEVSTGLELAPFALRPIGLAALTKAA